MKRFPIMTRGLLAMTTRFQAITMRRLLVAEYDEASNDNEEEVLVD
jgi:hypothetical protein